MKYRVIRFALRSREWANTKKGEQIITTCGGVLFGVWVISFTLLIMGL